MKRIIGITFMILAVALFSCQNEDANTQNTDELLSEKAATIALTEVQLEATANDTEYEVEFFANAEEMLTRWWRMGKKFGWSNKLRYKKQCPDVTVVEGNNDGYPKTITLNYGEGTELKNEKVLSGVIVIELSAPRKSKDYVRTVSYNNFGVDSLLVNGTSTSTVDKVDDMFRQFTSDFIFTLADGETEVHRTSERTWQWVEGMDSQDDQSDDVMRITGTVDATMGTDAYKKDITTPLKRLGDCKYIVEGIVTITLNNDVLCIMDYGDGTCDEIALVTKDGETTELDLSKRKMKDRKKTN